MTIPVFSFGLVFFNSFSNFWIPQQFVYRADGSRERMRAKCVDEALVLTSGNRELRAHLMSTDAKNLPHNEANRAFIVSIWLFCEITPAHIVDVISLYWFSSFCIRVGGSGQLRSADAKFCSNEYERNARL